MTRKPDGLPEFQKLLGGLAKAPKQELDEQVEKWKQRKKAAKRKKKA